MNRSAQMEIWHVALKRLGSKIVIMTSLVSIFLGGRSCSSKLWICTHICLYFACNSNLYRWWENSGEARGGEFGHTFSQKPFPKTHIASNKLPFQRNLVSQPPFFRGELWNFGGVSWKTFRLITESFCFVGWNSTKDLPKQHDGTFWAVSPFFLFLPPLRFGLFRLSRISILLLFFVWGSRWDFLN